MKIAVAPSGLVVSTRLCTAGPRRSSHARLLQPRGTETVKACSIGSVICSSSIISRKDRGSRSARAIRVAIRARSRTMRSLRAPNRSPSRRASQLAPEPAAGVGVVPDPGLFSRRFPRYDGGNAARIGGDFQHRAHRRCAVARAAPAGDRRAARRLQRCPRARAVRRVDRAGVRPHRDAPSSRSARSDPRRAAANPYPAHELRRPFESLGSPRRQPCFVLWSLEGVCDVEF